MTQSELSADLLNRGLQMFTMTLADFSDEDMLVRPVPHANHATWQVGHLILAESSIVNAIQPGTAGELPAGFTEKFSKETSSRDDGFPGKTALLEQLAKTRAATVALVKSLKPADLDKPGPERMAQFAPTVGHLVAMLNSHGMMHMGQFQVIRRKLGKPVLF